MAQAYQQQQSSTQSDLDETNDTPIQNRGTQQTLNTVLEESENSQTDTMEKLQRKLKEQEEEITMLKLSK